ncbi:MAG: hypothetical protein U0271_44785 [Polyangiaceae bacterium]
MNSMIWSVQWSHVTSAGSVTSIVCGPSNGASCCRAPSKSTGKTGGSMIGTDPHGVLPAVTGGSSGSSLLSFTASAIR